MQLVSTGQVDESTIRFEWLAAGPVAMDRSGKPKFPKLPQRPGAYRFRFTNTDSSDAGIYVGETDNLARRMNGYRSPGPSTTTNQRLFERFGVVLAAGGAVALDVAIEATLNGEPLDLRSRPSRLVVENTALLSAARDGFQVENL